MTIFTYKPYYMLRSNALLNKIKIESEMIKTNLPLNKEVSQILDKKFRLEFNYNSNHIEGNTLTYSETELLLIFDKTNGGHEYRELEEMKAHDVALLMIKEAALDPERPLTEQFIKNINECLLIKPFYKEAITQTGAPTLKQIFPGQYKSTPNSVLLKNGEIFHYAEPADVQFKVSELVKWFNENKTNTDPLKLAATFHYEFVLIHPFDDGNGRTARLLMNYILLMFDLPMVVIKTAEKESYLTALHYADSGQIDYFIDYIGNQLLWSLNITMKAIKGEDIEEEEDLDKALKMLTANLIAIPNEFEEEQTIEATSDVLIKSIFPLFKEIDNKLRLIEELFVNINFSINTSERDNSNDTIHHYILSRDKAIQYMNNETFKNTELILGSDISIECSTLRKASEVININRRILINFTEYHYTFEDEATFEQFCKLPYGRFLSKSQIDTIVKFEMYSIIEEIKRAVNVG